MASSSRSSQSAQTANNSGSFGAFLQTLRRDRKLTQIDLSSISKLSKSYVSFLESGVRHPSRDAVLKLAEALEPADFALRDELLVLAGFTPQDGLPARPAGPSYSREDLKSFLQHTLHLIRQQEFQKAQKEIETGFERFHRPAQLRTLMAHLELARKDFEQAILFQKNALQAYDLSAEEQDKGLTLVDFILNLGVMYFLWGDQARFGTDTPAQRKLALERYRLALETFESGLKHAPDHLYLLDEAGRVHINLADLLKGEPAQLHWEASINCFRQVLAHPDKHSLPLQTLYDSGAFLALAYARCKRFELAELLLDSLDLDQQATWTLPYIRACCQLLVYRSKPTDTLLDQALAALAQAYAKDADAVRVQFEQDKTRDFAPLLRARPQDIQKAIPDL